MPSSCNQREQVSEAMVLVITVYLALYFFFAPLGNTTIELILQDLHLFTSHESTE
ncbi:hypothetical protein ACJX0J_012733, partial [Zea mays]